MTTTILSQKHKLNSSIESLAAIEGIIDKICVDYKIKEEVSGNIFVAVTEAVNNAINHGNKLDPKKTIDLEYSLSESELAFKVGDMGEGFDYSNIPDPTDPENIYKPYGRGIFIMQHLSDEIRFEDQGRIVNLKFKYNSASL